MTDISPQICVQIHRVPLEPAIGKFRNSLRLVTVQANTDTQGAGKLSSEDSDSTENDSSRDSILHEEQDVDEDPKETISSLILAFQGHRIAKQLRVPGSSIKLDRDLASLYSRLGNEDINTECFMPLIEAIVAQVTDVEIWKLVLQLIDLTKPINPINPKDPTTPPTSQPSFCGTPRMSNSGSHEGFEETADFLEDGLREEFKNCSYTHVEGFFEKHFEGKSWSSQWKKVFEAIRLEFVDNRWTRLSSPLAERVFWEMTTTSR